MAGDTVAEVPATGMALARDTGMALGTAMVAEVPAMAAAAPDFGAHTTAAGDWADRRDSLCVRVERVARVGRERRSLSRLAGLAAGFPRPTPIASYRTAGVLRRDPDRPRTFLTADVEVVATCELHNINRTKLENLIYRIFATARLDIETKDRFGNPVVRRE